MSDRKLWLKNNTGADVSLSDLGVKVLANSSVNVYAYNPNLTDAQVEKSKENGSLYKRLNSGVLSVTKGAKSPKPHTLDHIKTSKKSVQVVKTKTAVFIDTKDEDVLVDDDFGNFADYGLGELGHENTKNVQSSSGVVVVKQKEDSVVEEKSDAVVDIETQTNVSSQSVVAMANQAEKMSNPVGNMAKDVSRADQAYVVVDPPAASEQDNPTEAGSDTASLVKDGDSIFVDGKTVGGRNLKTVSELNKIAKKQGVDVSDLPEETVVTADADTVIKDEAKYDSRVATKDDSGAVLMKVKEVSKEDKEPKLDEATPKKVSKTKSAKKKVKKKTKKTKKK
jgi:hypothetical protein